mgnify:CR=1 FL=1
MLIFVAEEKSVKFERWNYSTIKARSSTKKKIEKLCNTMESTQVCIFIFQKLSKSLKHCFTSVKCVSKIKKLVIFVTFGRF